MAPVSVSAAATGGGRSVVARAAPGASVFNPSMNSNQAAASIAWMFHSFDSTLNNTKYMLALMQRIEIYILMLVALLYSAAVAGLVAGLCYYYSHWKRRRQRRRRNASGAANSREDARKPTSAAGAKQSISSYAGAALLTRQSTMARTPLGAASSLNSDRSVGCNRGQAMNSRPQAHGHGLDRAGALNEVDEKTSSISGSVDDTVVGARPPTAFDPRGNRSMSKRKLSPRVSAAINASPQSPMAQVAL